MPEEQALPSPEDYLAYLKDAEATGCFFAEKGDPYSAKERFFMAVYTMIVTVFVAWVCSTIASEITGMIISFIVGGIFTAVVEAVCLIPLIKLTLKQDSSKSLALKVFQWILMLISVSLALFLILFLAVNANMETDTGGKTAGPKQYGIALGQWFFGQLVSKYLSHKLMVALGLHKMCSCAGGKGSDVVMEAGEA